ncbi:hypothetical protein KQH42_29810 [Streptomyces sp. CHA1]|uniref:hypothetical protein n=3 Tax=Streptomyces TaxID=1883 RepID=UPI0002D884A6|nr:MULTISPECIES: hypothetical protein [Streptomyces]QOZ97988.1 hypothetical protein DI273_00370 [Streptomyces violascens]ESP95796.1 hypothetical protein B591_29949 [Streptomyces sp. GBA 94-10 4N24]ESQ01705.1 hypothetical protein B591_00350 [Streptomyces sp. GBA 94-10 4N24]ESQ01852.1 hypothetical protein B590_29719 [Streptomyces sp. PVA_94-07]ESQ07711.1 hypothetical protein B590_00320 [Streptomyces sp. PVA_94-07]
MTTQQTTRTAATATTAGPLRLFLALDAAVTGANGLIYLLAAGPVGRLLDVDSNFLRGIGVFLTVYGIAVAALAAKPLPSSAATKAVIEINALWALGSIAAVVFGWLDPNTVGTVWIPLQAVLVAAFAALQYGALRKTRY